MAKRKKKAKKKAPPPDIPLLPWERRPKESNPAWQAFQIYRDLGDERSLSKVARQLDKSRQLMGEWSAKHEWVRRCADWDREKDREARKAQLKEIRDMNKRHIRIAMGGLSAVVNSLRRYIPTDNAPRPPPMPDAMVARFFEMCTKVERLARGEPDSIQQQETKLTVDAMRSSMRKLLNDEQAVEALQLLSKRLGVDGSNGTED